MSEENYIDKVIRCKRSHLYIGKRCPKCHQIESCIDQLIEDTKMDKERKDKGTVRELTELAEIVISKKAEAKRKIQLTKEEIRDLLSELIIEVENTFNDIEEEVRSFDQRDRLEKDKV